MKNDSMMSLMTFHFSSRVPGGLLFARWKVDSSTGKSLARPVMAASLDCCVCRPGGCCGGSVSASHTV